MDNKVLIETSARHVHVTKEDLETLFGKGYELTCKKELSQPGQFASNERVDIVGPKRTLSGVSILGPVRPATQVELSLTDARSIGVKAPIRESGDIEGSAGCKLVGPCGEVELEKALLLQRDIFMLLPRMLKDSAFPMGIVSLKVTSKERSTVFGDVVVRVSPKFGLAAHFDTDEANAAALAGEVYGEVIKG